MGWGVFSAPSHKHNAQRVQSLQNIKIPPAILSCNIHVDTTETTSFSPPLTVLVFSLAVNGLGPRREEDFTPILAVAVPEKVTQVFQPSCLASGKGGGLRRTPSVQD